MCTQDALLELLFVGTEVYCHTAGHSLAGAARLLEVLACVEPCRARPFADLIHAVLGRTGVFSGCILILLAWDEVRQGLVRQLRVLNVPLRVLVVGDADMPEPAPGVLADRPDVLHLLRVGQVERGLARL